MATLVIKSPDGNEQEQDVAGQLTIGRGEGNDLVLTEGGVSRRHARFFLEEDELLVEDVGSANGTWVDGERIEQPVPVSAESQVVIGDYEISVRPAKRGGKALSKASGRGVPRGTKVVAAIKAPSTTKKPGAGRSAAGPQLRGLTGSITGKIFPLVGKVVVGRVGGTDITLDDDSVSRRHAELEVRGRTVTLRDLGSANGTTVNGAPLTEDTALSPGDIIQFGVVEVMFETTSPSGTRAPVRRPPPGGRRPLRGDSEHDLRPTEDSSAGLDPRKKRLLVMAGGTFAVLLALVLLKAFTTHDKVDQGVTPLVPGRGPAGKVPKPVDPVDEIEALLTECRTYSSPEIGKPDWPRAEAACQKVIELEPIHGDANLLIKKIKIERACEEALDRGRELKVATRFEESLDFFAKVGAKPGDCQTYYLRAMAEAVEPVAEVKKTAGRECKDYSTNAKWENAYKRCEVYMRLACQVMEPKDLYPPPLSKLKLDGPVGRGEWRPTDPLYINFLKAREHMKPGDATVWQCPEIRAFRPAPPPPDPSQRAREELLKRYPQDPGFGQALVAYFEGKSDPTLPLKKIRESMSKASEHELAKKLIEDIGAAQSLTDTGASELANDKPEKAELPFRQALELDERLVLGDRAKSMSDDEKRRELEKRASYVRRTIVESMASKCYERGKQAADRKNFREACKLWKLGASFSRGNIDLLKALTNVCTKKAGEMLERADGCEQLKEALNYAVDGDGYKKQIVDRMTEEGCTGP